MRNKLIVSKKLIHFCKDADGFMECLQRLNNNKFIIYNGVVFSSAGDVLVTVEDLVIVDRILLPNITEIMDVSPNTSPATIYLGDAYIYNKEKADRFFSGVKPEDIVIFNGPHLANFISDIDKKCKYVHLNEFLTLCINAKYYNFVKHTNRGNTTVINKDDIEFQLYKTIWTAAYYDKDDNMQFKELNKGVDLLEFIGGINMRRFNMQPILDKTRSDIENNLTAYCKSFSRAKAYDKKDCIGYYFVEPISLAIVSIGYNPASEVYMKAKFKCCNEFNIPSRHYTFSDERYTGEDFFGYLVKRLEEIEKENTGTILQLPIESNILTDEQKSILSSMVGRFGGDVDAFGTKALADVMTNRNPRMLPCTVQGVKDIMQAYVSEELPDKYSASNNSYAGLKVVVIGRSKIVGMPLINNLIMQDADVVAMHSKNMTLDVNDPKWQDVDVIVLATGCYGVIDTEFLNYLVARNKKKIFVIDVGINRINGKLHGDLKINSDENDMITYTPVPGGVGKTTVLNLVKNLTIIALDK
ncbi:MAG: hypothetical protein ACRCX2_28975 [Paraclostridium sp.]